MTDSPWREAEDFDDARQRAYVLTACAFLALMTIVLIARDPVWRLLHEGDLVSGVHQPSSGWTELDRKLIEDLSSVEIRSVRGLEPLEDAVMIALQSRRENEIPLAPEIPADANSRSRPLAFRAPSGPVPATISPPTEESRKRLVESTRLREMARSRAAQRLAVPSSRELKAVEMRFPETYFAITHSRRLVRSMEVAQRLPANAPVEESGFAEELVSGWMNRLRFGSTLMRGRHLEVGVGAVVSEEGDLVVEVLLVEVFAELENELPVWLEKGTPLELRGRRLDDRDLVLYFKGPADPGFYPLETRWNGMRFSVQIDWEQGAGNYALRAGQGDRLSDPRPVFVE